MANMAVFLPLCKAIRKEQNKMNASVYCTKYETNNWQTCIIYLNAFKILGNLKSPKKAVVYPHALFPSRLVITLLNPNMASWTTTDHCKITAYRSRSQTSKTSNSGHPILDNPVPNTPVPMPLINAYSDIKEIQFMVITSIYRSYRVVSSSKVHLHMTKLDCAVRVDISLTAGGLEGSGSC